MALANLAIFEKENLVAKAATTTEYFHDKLQGLMNLPMVGEVRGDGLLAAVQLVSDKQTKTIHDPADKVPYQVAAKMREAGVIVRPLPAAGSLAMSPPLTISEAEVDELVQAMGDAIQSMS